MMCFPDEPYKTRPIRYLGLWEFDHWRMKTYGIAYETPAPSAELVASARDIVERRIRESGNDTDHYGIGFVGIHQGKTGNFVFIDWWAKENELYHHVYISTKEQPQALKYMTPTGLSACTWDLHLIGFERDAWVETVLKRHPEPDLDAYLAHTLEADV
jgi:hypothetical protein